MLDTSVSKTPRTKSSLARAPDLQDLVSMMTESMPFNVTGDASSRQEEEQRKQHQHQQKLGGRSEPTNDYDLDDKENVGGNGESGSLRKKGKQQMLPKVGSDSGSSSQDQGKLTVAGVERSPLSDKTPFVAVKSKKEQREDISNRGAAANLAEHAKIESEVSREIQLAGVDSAKSGGSGRDSIGRSASLSVCTENHTQRPPAARASSREGRSREQRKVEGKEEEKEKEKEKEVGSRSRSRSRSTARGEARGRMMDRHAELEGRIQRLASSCERERESGMGVAPVHAPSPNHTGAVITLGQPGQALLQHQHQHHHHHHQQQQHRKEQEKKSERRQESPTEAGQPLPQSRDEAADAAQIKQAPQAAAAAAPQQPTTTTTSSSSTTTATTPALVTTITTKVGTQTDVVSLEKLPWYSSSATQTPPDQELARAKGDAERLEATVADLVETYTMVSERKKVMNSAPTLYVSSPLPLSLSVSLSLSLSVTLSSFHALHYSFLPNSIPRFLHPRSTMHRFHSFHP